MKPTSTQVKVLRHLSVLRSAELVPAKGDGRFHIAEVARIVDAFPQQQTSALKGAIMAQAYIAAVADQPAWALIEARRRIFTGQTPFGRPFAPTSVQLRDLVLAVMLPYRQELFDLECLLQAIGAPEPDPEVKQFVSDGFDDLRRELAGTKGVMPTAAKPVGEIAAGVADRLKDYPRVKPKAEPPIDVWDEMGWGKTMDPG